MAADHGAPTRIVLLALVALGLIIFVVTAIGIYAIIRNSIRLPRPHDIEASTRVFNWRDDPNMQSMTFSVSPSCPALFGIDMGKSVHIVQIVVTPPTPAKKTKTSAEWHVM